MKLEVLRFSSQKDSTSGILFDISNNKRKFLCYTLEDEARIEKVRGETCIPAGEYSLGLRTVGGLDARYSTRFADIHLGMLHVLDVPNFKYILIHCGNTDEDTAGCLLLGDTQNSNLVQKDGFIGRSTLAYMRTYPAIAEALSRGAEVTIKYTDYDK
jgi:hypothetical protein|tara:strand:- start:727 stop:1197 length:471 start_codon:yes stop_codon:yes gene_type:complete